MLYDIIFVVTVVIFAFIGVKTGAAKTILSILAFVAAIAGAVVLAQLLSGVIFDVFIKQSVTEKIDVVLNDPTIVTATGVAQGVINSLPGIVVGTMGYFGLNTKGLISVCENATKTQSSNVSDAIANALKPSVSGIVAVFLFILLFVILLFVAKKLAKLVGGLFRLPLIRTVDSVAGFILGVAEGILIVFVLSLLLKLAVPLISSDVYIFSENYINSSVLFSPLYRGGLTSFVQAFVFRS